jgi:hypothetical protein
VEAVREKRGQIFLSIRPEINCPEIDPVDEVKLENVIQCFDGEEIEIGYRVEYVVSGQPGFNESDSLGLE